MRKAALAISVLLALGGSSVPAQTQKAPHLDVGSGRVAWFDITTTDVAKSKDFYGKLFGWQFTALAGTDRAVEIVAEGQPIGTIRSADGPISGFNGMAYIQVNDIQASCQKARELGGTVPPGFPFNLTNRPGAIAVVVDPSGHPVGMYSRTSLPPKPPAK